MMAGSPVREPLADHLLRPQDVAMLVIDYQLPQFAGVRSMARDLLLENVVSTAKRLGLPVAEADAIEIVLSERLLRA